MVLAQEVLRLLEPAHQQTRPPAPPGDRLDQVAQPLERDPGAMHLLGVRCIAGPDEILPHPRDLLADQPTRNLSQ